MKINIFTNKHQEAQDVLKEVLDQFNIRKVKSYDGLIIFSIKAKDVCVEVITQYRLNLLCESLIKNGVISFDTDMLIEL